MTRLRHARLPLALTSALLLGSLGAGATTAADEPEAAIRALLDAAASRQLGDLDGLVCSEQQETIRSGLGDAGLGLEGLVQGLGSVRVAFEEVEFETLEADDDRVVGAVTGAIRVDVDEAALRDLVLELLEAGAVAGDPAPTTADVDAALPFVSDMLGLRRQMDELVTVVVEGGEWVVCGGFGIGLPAYDEQDGSAPAVSAEGLCALATPQELSELGPWTYDSSAGFNDSCTYHRSKWAAYHAATVLLLPDTSLDDWREVYQPDGEFEIDGAPAFSSGANLFAAAGEDVLEVIVTPPQRAAGDVKKAVNQARRISGLFLSRLDGLVDHDHEPHADR